MSNASFTRLWAMYQAAVRDGALAGLDELGLTGLGERRQIGFTDPGLTNDSEQIIAQLLQRCSQLEETKGTFMPPAANDEQRIFALGLQWLKAAETDDAESIKALRADGFPVNFQHPETLETALHIASAGNGIKTIEILDASGECDFLLRDARGKLAWNNAEFFGRNEQITALLLKRTKAQARVEEIDLLQEHRTHLRQWFTQPWYQTLEADQHNDLEID